MNVSVIISTYNRCESLRRTLQTCCELEIPRGVTWELLVVDNNSHDATRQVCESFAGRLPLRHTFEPRQGVSCARNRGVAETTAPIVMFTDDDIDVDQQWLASLYNAVERHPEISIFGGRIFPRWEQPPPAWVQENSESMLRPLVAHLDLGDQEKVLTDTCAAPWGPSMVFRRSVLTPRFRFREDVGRNGQNHIRAGETELIQRLVKAGHQRLYVPQAIVYHRNPPDCATERFVFAYYMGAGITEMRLQGAPAATNLWAGVPRYYWVKFMRHSFQYALSRWTKPSPTWVRAEIDAAKNWGRITELRRLRAQPGLFPHRTRPSFVKL
jgi:glycosyltransferase involved in cell wall biosynthesis